MFLGASFFDRSIALINNFYTLHHLAAELKKRAHGTALDRPFTQFRNELVLPFEPVERGPEPFVAVVSCEPSRNVLFFKDEYPRAKRNTGNVFPDIQGALVDDVLMHPSDREIRITFRPGFAIVMQFFGSKANVLKTDADGTVTASFLRQHSSVGAWIDPHPPMPAGVPSAGALRAALNENPGTPLTSVVKRAFPGFGTLLVRELLFRCGLEGTELSGDQSASTIASLLSLSAQLMAELLTVPQPGIYYREDQAEKFTIIPLRHLAHLRREPCSTVSDAIRQHISSTRRQSDFMKEKGRLLEAIRDEVERAGSTAGKVRSEIPTRAEAEHCERYGKLLQASLYSLRKGEREAVVEDMLSPGREIVAIPMDPHLTPAKNAERYFEKAKKIRTSIEEQNDRLASLEKIAALLGPLADRLDGVESAEDLEAFLSDAGELLRSSGIRVTIAERKKEEERPPFRIYHVDGGFQVWAGKSGENNDLLTTRHTAKNDLWFHARGVGGSHVVLKAGTGKGHFSRKAILQAAGIAAYYSKMKKASHVPVTMCEGKYVRKPKGAATGTVTVEREEVVYATPRLPASAGEGTGGL